MSMYFLRCKGTNSRKSDEIEMLINQNNKLRDENNKLKIDNDKLIKIKFADEDIFALIKCINEPRKQVCDDTPEGKVCRSRFMDCTKFKRIVSSDPVAEYRMRMAMNL